MTRISFIVPTYNRAGFIGEALGAILAQAGDEDEVLVVDDGSTDDTPAVVQALGARVRYVRQDNAGKAEALNRAMGLTDGEYVWICDDDDILRPRAVALLVEAIADSGAGFVFGRYTRFRETADGARTDLGTGYWPDLSSGSLLRHILDDAFVMQNATLARRSAYEAAGPFSVAMPRSLDYEMFVRLALTQTCAFVDSVVFDQRKHDGARGPASARHAAQTVNAVWQKYDAAIFRNLHQSLDVDFFARLFTPGDAPLAQRAAFLQRASIMARHECWDEAIADWESAAALSSEDLTLAEAQACRRSLMGKHGFRSLVESHPHLVRLRALRKKALGRRMVNEILAGTRWRFRYDTPAGREDTIRLYLFMRSVRPLFSGDAPKGFAQTLKERNDMPRSLLLPARAIPPVQNLA